MIKEIIMYTVACDNCGRDVNRDLEFSCWADKQTSVDIAQDLDWHKEGEKHYCPNCFEFDDNDKLIIKK